MKFPIKRLTYLLGFAGPTLIILGSFLTALAYTGRLGERYSFLNHFISELGETGISEWAIVFNASLFIGGLCITGFMLGTAIRFGNWFGWLFGLVGLVTGLAGSLVGVFPMNNLSIHMPVALTFFRMALTASALFAIYVLIFRQDRFPRWVGLPAASVSAVTFIFLFIVKPVGSEGQVLSMPGKSRPDFWPSAFVEWGIFFMVMLWILVTAGYLFREGTQKP